MIIILQAKVSKYKLFYIIFYTKSVLYIIFVYCMVLMLHARERSYCFFRWPYYLKYLGKSPSRGVLTGGVTTLTPNHPPKHHSLFLWKLSELIFTLLHGFRLLALRRFLASHQWVHHSPPHLCLHQSWYKIVLYMTHIFHCILILTFCNCKWLSYIL